MHMHFNYAEMFVWMLLGHLIGDYWCQNEWMASNKAHRNRKGWLACGLHVVIYSLVVMLFIMAGAALQGRWFVGNEVLLWLALIGIPHYVIDHYSLASKFMAMKNGIHPWKILKEGDPVTIKKQWDVAFTAPVYIVTDNTAHLLMMWLMLRFML